MHIDPFAVEIWMNAHETRCRHNLAETCVQSLTVSELLELAGHGPDALFDLLPMRLGYGDITGSDKLRDAVAGLYSRRMQGDVMICHGTAGANALAWQALVGPGDRVVTLVPTYQQHVSIPESLGAEVVRFPLRPTDWLPDIDALRRVAGGAKVIAMTNPNNPTGALIPPDMLAEIVAIARAEGAWLLADEVYRGTGPQGLTPSVTDLYDRGISTAGMSKAFSLAGLRLGWVVGSPDLLEAVSRHRDYSTISVGGIDDHLAALALEASEGILARARAITGANRAHLAEWLAAEEGVSWVEPRAGTTALLTYDLDIPSEQLCLDLLAETGVLLTPGSALGVEGTVRIGYGNSEDAMRAGLPLMTRFLARRRTEAVRPVPA